MIFNIQKNFSYNRIFLQKVILYKIVLEIMTKNFVDITFCKKYLCYEEKSLNINYDKRGPHYFRPPCLCFYKQFQSIEETENAVHQTTTSDVNRKLDEEKSNLNSLNETIQTNPIHTAKTVKVTIHPVIESHDKEPIKYAESQINTDPPIEDLFVDDVNNIVKEYEEIKKDENNDKVLDNEILEYIELKETELKNSLTSEESSTDEESSLNEELPVVKIYHSQILLEDLWVIRPQIQESGGPPREEDPWMVRSLRHLSPRMLLKPLIHRSGGSSDRGVPPRGGGSECGKTHMIPKKH